jgi:oligoendopeptidase F
MKSARHYQLKMAKWLMKAEDAITRKKAIKALKKFKKHQTSYSKCYDQEAQTQGERHDDASDQENKKD